MNRLWKPLKKIGERLVHIKDKNIEKYSRFNIYCQDESRFGLLTLAHKALTRKGVKPLCNYEHRFDNTYLFGAFSPLRRQSPDTGNAFGVTAVPSRRF